MGAGQRAEVLYQITLSAARMLLITRAMSLALMLRCSANTCVIFIETGLVDAKYFPLVSLAEKERPGWHRGQV